MKRTSYKTTFGLIKRIFVELLTGIVNGPNHTEPTYLNVQPTLINLHPNEYSQKPYY